VLLEQRLGLSQQFNQRAPECQEGLHAVVWERFGESDVVFQRHGGNISVATTIVKTFIDTAARLR